MDSPECRGVLPYALLIKKEVIITKNWKLFKIFFKIGAFTIGGGYAMLHLIEYELVEKEKLLDYDTFHDGLALSQTSPGPIAVNISIFLGYRLGGYASALLCAFATILPAFLIISLLTGFLLEYAENPYLVKFFQGIRPAVGAMITFSLINLLRKSKKNYLSIITMIISFILLTFLSISPITIIIALIVFSIISSLVKK